LFELLCTQPTRSDTADKAKRDSLLPHRSTDGANRYRHQPPTVNATGAVLR